MSNLNQNILDVVKDAEFAKRVSELKTPEEVQAAFKEKGVDITLQDVDVIAAAIKQKLEDDAIGSVAGGGFTDFFWVKGTDAKLEKVEDKTKLSAEEQKGVFNTQLVGESAAADYRLVQGTPGHLTTAGKVGAGVGGVAALAAAGYGIYKGAQDIYAKIKSRKETH